MVNAANALDAFRSDKSRLNLNSSADYFSVQRSIPVNGQFYLISITGSTRFSATRLTPNYTGAGNTIGLFGGTVGVGNSPAREFNLEHLK